MFLKLMSDENLSDQNPAKQYQLIECTSVDFYRDGYMDTKGPVAVVWKADAHLHSVQTLRGNAYVLNNSGKTIESFALSRVTEQKMPRVPHVFFESMTGTHGVQRQLELMLAEAVIRKDDMTESANTARRLGASAQDMLGITYGEGICSGEVGVLCVLLNKCSDAYNGQAFDSKWARTVLTSGQKADDSSWS